MFCCACNGTCNHVGPHSYCAPHGGSPYSQTLIRADATLVISPEPQESFRGLAEHLMSVLAFLRNDFEGLAGDEPTDDQLLLLNYSEYAILRARRELYG